ncbi:MAG: hypothetical protein H7255_01840, partial [Ramlibacter sp.]|nr:hypothetical protein [Ramlibacter sp.]
MKNFVATTMLSGVLLAAGAATVLVACGGGGDDGLGVVGVAATGAAMASASVSARCASGTATNTATTSFDGSFVIKVPQGSLPCLIEVSDGTRKLHSIATSNSPINVTPLTEQVVGQISPDTAAYFASFDSAAAAALTGSRISTAQTAVFAALTASGNTAPASVTDLLTSALVAKTAAQAGNDHDKLLEKVAASSVTVKLIAMNDFHGNIELPAAGNGGQVILPNPSVPGGTTATVGGAAYLATVVKNLKA